MVKKEDIYEFNATIVALEKRQSKARNLAAALLDEIEELEGMIEVLKHDYKILKEKCED